MAKITFSHLGAADIAKRASLRATIDILKTMYTFVIARPPYSRVLLFGPIFPLTVQKP